VTVYCERKKLEMTTSIVTFKLIVEKDQKSTGDIRRVSLPQPAKYSHLVAAAKDLLDADEVKFRYVDDDGDRIVLSSEYELQTAVGLSASGNAVRLFVEVVKEREAKPAAKVEEKKVEDVPKVEQPKAEEKKPEPEKPKVEEPKVEEPPKVEEEKPKTEEKKPEAAAAAPEDEKKEEEAAQNPFAELFRNFRNVPGIQCTQGADGASVVDIDFNKLFSPENSANVWGQVSETLGKVAAAAQEQKKKDDSELASALKPDESAGVYSHVIHTLPSNVVHYHVICDGCGKHDICGVRYKCAQCDDYDLCQDCIRKAGSLHDPTHMFYPMCVPAFGRRSHFGPRFGPHGRMGPHPFHCRPGFACPPHPQAQPQPQPQPKPQPQPQPELKPVHVAPEPEKPKAEPEKNPQAVKKDDPHDAKFAHLGMTKEEMDMVSTLIDMGFPNVERDLCYLRYYGGVINDDVIEVLVRYPRHPQ